MTPASLIFSGKLCLGMFGRVLDGQYIGNTKQYQVVESKTVACDALDIGSGGLPRTNGGKAVNFSHSLLAS